MKIQCLSMLILLLSLACGDKAGSTNSAPDSNLQLGNAFVDAFYSFDRDSPGALLIAADDTRPGILYYQGWAEGGNYGILTRHPCVKKDDSVTICPVTVKDDLIQALELEEWVTDTFHITIVTDRIIAVATSSNDPDLYYEARDWVRANMPELIDEPCQGMWSDGETPGDCVRAMVAGYREFMASRRLE